MFLFVVPVLFLVSCFIAVLENDVTIVVVVVHNLIHQVVSLEHAVLVRELSQVVRSLGVVCVQCLNDVLVFLLLRQLLLIKPSHLVVLVHIEEIRVIF